VRHLIPRINGDEQDAFSGWRHYLRWRPGQRKQIKRAYRRRERQWLKREVRGQL
jgi:diadenosine tetraphosphate (Ap4A) HIT family hydrolase